MSDSFREALLEERSRGTQIPKKCVNCACARENKGAESLACHRFPPVILWHGPQDYHTGEVELIWGWPGVLEEDGCEEFSPSRAAIGRKVDKMNGKD